jgi:hypothetical protein
MASMWMQCQAGDCSYDDTVQELVSDILLRINTRTGAPANPTDVSRGIFGATVGIDRLLKLWDKYNIKSTWFVPAHSAESFPGQIQKVIDKGHEM